MKNRSLSSHNIIAIISHQSLFLQKRIKQIKENKFLSYDLISYYPLSMLFQNDLIFFQNLSKTRTIGINF